MAAAAPGGGAGGEPRRCVVLGAGVIGLTTAKALQDEGWRVDVWARAPGMMPAHALWECPPYLFRPEAEGCEWALVSLAEFRRIAATEPAAGVASAPNAYLSREPLPQRPQHDRIPGYCRGAEALRSPSVAPVSQGEGYADAEVYDSPVLDSKRYMRWLRGAIEGGGGRFTRVEVASIADAAAALPAGCDVLVNCTGLASRELVPDPGVFPCRGQVVTVRAPQVRAALCDEQTGAYCIPLPGTGLLELGGTADDHAGDRRPSAAATDGILDRCRRMIPSLRGCTVVDTWVGLRPKRDGGCRLELTTVARPGRAPCAVIHSYGHGGAGYIVSWGVARAAAALAAGAAGAAAPPARL